MTLPIIALVTDRRRYPDRVVETITAALAAGVNLIQIRERGLSDRALLELTRGAVRSAAGTGACVVVNDRADIALTGGAAGVHLRGDSVAAPRVRQLAPPGWLVGRSVHSVEEAVAVERLGGCDYLVFGTVFASASKPASHTPAGLGALRTVCGAVTLPVVAIGGITEGHAAAVAEAGAAGIAAIGLFAGTDDLARTVAALRRPFDSPRGVA